MDIKNDIKNGVKLCADAATDVAQALVEKSRLKAKANRIKQVIKADTELKNQALIELGRYYYENMRDASNDDCEALCTVIDKTTKRINKASTRYVELISDSSDVKLKSENTEKIKKIVTDTADDIKDKAKQTSQKAKVKAQDISAKAKETVFDLKDKAMDKVDDFKSFIAPEELDEEVVAELEEVTEPMCECADMVETTEESIEDISQPMISCDTEEDDEESPEEFEF